MTPKTLDHDEMHHITQFIRFRNPDSLYAIVTQMFLLVAACFVILGLLYVIIIVILITVHNFCYDRDPKAIPDYVKRSVQFSSDDDDSEFEYDLNNIDLFQRRKLSGSTSNKSFEWTRGQPTNAKKTQLLDKFLSDFNDRQRGVSSRNND